MIYFYLFWAFVGAPSLSLAAVSRLLTAGASLAWRTGSRRAGPRSCISWLSRCGPWASLLLSRSDLPTPGVRPTSLALTVGFLPTAPGKSHSVVFRCSGVYLQFWIVFAFMATLQWKFLIFLSNVPCQRKFSQLEVIKIILFHVF